MLSSWMEFGLFPDPRTFLLSKIRSGSGKSANGRGQRRIHHHHCTPFESWRSGQRPVAFLLHIKRSKAFKLDFKKTIKKSNVYISVYTRSVLFGGGFHSGVNKMGPGLFLRRRWLAWLHRDRMAAAPTNLHERPCLVVISSSPSGAHKRPCLVVHWVVWTGDRHVWLRCPHC